MKPIEYFGLQSVKMESIPLVVIISLLTFVLAVLFSVWLVRSYVLKRESTAFLSSISIGAITVTLICILLIPVDIYSISSGIDSSTGTHSNLSTLENTRQAIKALYYACYALCLLFAFIILPFGYFYFETHEERPARERAFTAAKWTIGFLIFFLVLMIAGLVIKRGKSEGTDWKAKLSNEFTIGDTMLGFCIGTLSCVGLTAYLLYASYGLARLPVRMMAAATYARSNPKNNINYNSVVDSSSDLRVPIRSGGNSGRQVTKLSNDELALQLRRVKAQIDYIENQYDSPNLSSWSAQHQKEIVELRREQRKYQAILQNRLEKEEKSTDPVERYRGSDFSFGKDFFAKCWNCCAPFRIVLAIPLLLLSFLIVVSMTITVIDKFLHSPCGPSCGYALDSPQIINPIDQALRFLNQFFPLDAIAFAGLVIYIYFACVHGMVSLGVRILVWKLYSIKKGNSYPHAIMMAAWFLMFIALVLNMQVLTLAPQYSTFGNQFYVTSSYNNATKSLEYSKYSCTVQISQYVPCNRTQSNGKAPAPFPLDRSSSSSANNPIVDSSTGVVPGPVPSSSSRSIIVSSTGADNPTSLPVPVLSTSSANPGNDTPAPKPAPVPAFSSTGLKKPPKESSTGEEPAGDSSGGPKPHKGSSTGGGPKPPKPTPTPSPAPVEECTLPDLDPSYAASVCKMSQVGIFINTVSVQLPFFAVILFYANLAFLALFISWFIWGLCRTKEEWNEGSFQTLEQELNEDSD
jgi:LMBR1 domain-containing protein 1